MLRVLTGYPEKRINNWLRGTVQYSFSYDVEPSWFEDSIVREALSDIDDIEGVLGVALKKRNGLVIPPQWLSHGVKQFISMTQDTSLVCNGRFFGWNVYKYFYKWSTERGSDVTLLLNDNSCLNEEVQMRGILLNTGEVFNNNRELANLIYSNRSVLLSDGNNGIITASKFKRDNNDNIRKYGKEFTIIL